MTEKRHNPDVLECLANLSNDEVFTPPNVANAMLDLLPQELFRSPDTTFLDPCCKSGIFLREIAKRLIVGLEKQIPDLQRRLDHIFHKQLFGLAITTATAITSRRTVYCSRHADGKYSVSPFPTNEGNIRLPHAEHDWEDDKCTFCGVSQKTVEAWHDSHAYPFIHGVNPERLFNMKFDVIIGNPPYQLQDGAGGQGSSARPLYNLFVEMGRELMPQYMVFITPSRWFVGGKGLDAFRDLMINDKQIAVLHDYPDSTECFPGVKIEGGVSYFLWRKGANAPCHVVTHMTGAATIENKRYLKEPELDVFIRHQIGLDILHKVRAKREATFETYVSSRKPFGLDSKFKDFQKTRSGKMIKVYANKSEGFMDRRAVLKSEEWIDSYKVYISFAYGMGDSSPYQVLNKPFVGEPGTCCTETYLHIGPFPSKAVAENVRMYIQTRFFRFLVMLKKITQNGTAKVYELVPQQDFSKPWTDAELYAKYGLSAEEIAFIESMVKPMEV